MAIRLRLSGKAKTVYVEHGVWFDDGTKRIHVTIPGAEGAHWSVGPSDSRQWSVYRAILQDQGRWPEDQEDRRSPDA